MSKINWKARIKHKTFWLALTPAFLMLLQVILGLFGVPIDIVIAEQSITTIINGVFTILAILGIVADPTTEGVGDSDLALSYDAPKGEDLEEAMTILGNNYTDDRSGNNEIEGISEEE